MPSRNLVRGGIWTTLGAVVVGLLGLFSFRERGEGEPDAAVQHLLTPRPTGTG